MRIAPKDRAGREALARWALLAAFGLMVAVIGRSAITILLHAGFSMEKIKTAASHFLLGEISWLAAIGGVQWGPDLVSFSPTLACVAGGCVWAFHGLLRVRWMHERYFASFNTDLFHIIEPAKAIDPLWGSLEGEAPGLVWLHPSGGERALAWQSLHAFVTSHAGSGISSFAGRPKLPSGTRQADFAFRWSVLSGSPGSGKTRHAMEFARRLSRARLQEGRTRHDRYRWAKLTVLEWIRRTWPPSRRRSSDPWDAGWLRPSAGVMEDTHDNRLDIAPSLIRALAAWRPRRPTLILLDDPRPEDSATVVRTLEEAHGEFRFPVRLLIVNQSVPHELKLATLDDGRTWTSTLPGFAGRVISLRRAAALTGAEVLAMAAQLGLPSRALPPSNSDGYAAFMVRTRGNALLVELALRRLRDGQDFTAIDATALLQGHAMRVARIGEALELGGFPARAFCRALAAATIAGPSAATRAGPGPLAGLIGKVELPDLRRLMNLDESASGALPPVRPEMIGDAFVEYVLDKECDTQEDADLVVAVAWRLNPLGVLRTLSRVDRWDGPLARALRGGPPERLGLDRVAIATGYCAAAMQAPREAWRPRQVSEQSLALEAALARIDHLDASQAYEALPEVMALARGKSADTVVFGWEALVCVATLAGRILDAADAPGYCAVAASAVIETLEIATQFATDTAFTAADRITAVVERLLAAEGEEAIAVRDGISALATNAVGWSFTGNKAGDVGRSRYIFRLLDALSADALLSHPMFADPRAAALVNIAATVAEASLAECESVVVNMERALPQHLMGSLPFDRYLAQAWANLVYSQKQFAAPSDDARLQIARIEAIIGSRYQHVAELIAVKVGAYVNLSTLLAEAGRVAECEALIPVIDAIIDPAFSGVEAFEWERAAAWSALGLATLNGGQLDRPKICALRADAVLAPFQFSALRSDWLRPQAGAWSYVAKACAIQDDLPGCEAAVRSIEQLVGQHGNADRWVALSHTQALAQLALIFSRRLDIDSVNTVWNRVERQINSGYNGKLMFELVRVGCFLNVSYVFSCLQRPVDAFTALLNMDAVIDPAFTGKAAFEEHRLRAILNMACAGGDCGVIRDMAARAEAVVDPRFTGQETFELLLAKTLGELARSLRASGLPNEAETIVAQIDRRIDPAFTGIAEFEETRTRSRQ